MFKIEERKVGDRGWARLGGTYRSTEEAWEAIWHFKQRDITHCWKKQAPRREYRIVSK